jgi:MipA family protein
LRAFSSLNAKSSSTHHQACTTWRYATTSLLALGAALAQVPAHAQTADKPAASTAAKPVDPWTVSLGLGVVSTPHYEGADKRSTSVLPDLNVKYSTRDFGSFSLGSKNRGLSWTMVDKEAYSFGIGLQGDAGRTDTKDGTALKPGSKRLLGMGEIKPSLEFAAFGHVVLGVPFILQVAKGAGDGKADAKDFSIKGPGGTRVELSSEIPFEITKAFGLSLSPSVSWADDKFTQAYFGVTPEQAARTGFKAFKAKGGVRSVGLALGANYKFDAHWSANALLSFSQLQGDAAKSPLVQKKGQATVIFGAAYEF